jgi:hypothetical protein
MEFLRKLFRKKDSSSRPERVGEDARMHLSFPDRSEESRPNMDTNVNLIRGPDASPSAQHDNHQTILKDTPEQLGRYSGAGLSWDQVDDETKATAQWIRERIRETLSAHLDRVRKLSPPFQKQVQSMLKFYEPNEPEIISKAVDCWMVKESSQLFYTYPDQSTALVVTLLHKTIEGAKAMLKEISRDPNYGYVDLLARLTDQLPQHVGGLYHLILLMEDRVVVNVAMSNLAGRDIQPFEAGLMPTSLLNNYEKTRLEL